MDPVECAGGRGGPDGVVRGFDGTLAGQRCVEVLIYLT